MFRQKLRGGHRVGPSLKQNAPSTFNTDPQNHKQLTATDVGWDAWSADNSWNWDSQADGADQNINGGKLISSSTQSTYPYESVQHDSELNSNNIPTHSQNQVAAPPLEEWNNWEEWDSEGNIGDVQKQNNNNALQSSVTHNTSTSIKNKTSSTDKYIGSENNHYIDQEHPNVESCYRDENNQKNVSCSNLDNWGNFENTLEKETRKCFVQSDFSATAIGDALKPDLANSNAESVSASNAQEADAWNWNADDWGENVGTDFHNKKDLSDCMKMSTSSECMDNFPSLSSQVSALNAGTSSFVNTGSSEYNSVLPTIAITEPSPVEKNFPSNSIYLSNTKNPVQEPIQDDKPLSSNDFPENVNLIDDWEDGWDARPESERCDMNGVDDGGIILKTEGNVNTQSSVTSHSSMQFGINRQASEDSGNDTLDKNLKEVTDQLNFAMNDSEDSLPADEQEEMLKDSNFDLGVQSESIDETATSLSDIKETVSDELSTEELQYIRSTMIDSSPKVSFYLSSAGREYQKSRSQSVSEYRVPARSRTASETIDGDINVLKEELKDIFSAPTDLTTYVSNEEVRLRSDSLTKSSLPDPLKYDTSDITEYLSKESSQELSSSACDMNYECEAKLDVASSHPSVITQPLVVMPKNIERPAVNHTLSPTFSPSGAKHNLQARLGSPFQPPTAKKYPDTSLCTVNVTNTDIAVENLVTSVSKVDLGISSTLANGISSNVPVCREADGTSKLPINIRTTKPIQKINNHVDNGMTIDHSSPSDCKPMMKRKDSEESSTNSEHSLTRMVPGESTKGETKNIFQAPPAMPTDRVVTGNDDPQPMPSRIKQEPTIRCIPDMPNVTPKKEHITSVVPPVRSETIGSEEPSIIPVAKEEKVGPSRHPRDSWDRESSSGEYYQDRYIERPSQSRYYKNSSPNSRHSYDSRYKDRRPRKYDSDEDDDDDDDYYREGRGRRRRGYRDDGYDREEYYRRRDPRYEKKRSQYSAHDYEDSVFVKPESRSRPSSRSSSLTNLENEGISRDAYYERQRRPREHSFRDTTDFRHDRKDPRDAFMRGK